MMDMSLATSSWWFDDQPDLIRDCLADSPIVEKDTATVVNLIDTHHSHSLSSPSDQSNSTTATPNLTALTNCFTQPNYNCPLSPNSRPNINDTLNYIPESCNNHNNNTAEPLEKCGSQNNETCPDMGTDHEHDGRKLKKVKRTGKECHNHVLAERQRRQNLSQCFIALSALVPGLKKMDKCTILGEAINHMKQLRESVKMLQELDTARSSGVKSAVLLKRSQVLVSENESNSSSSLSSSSSSSSLNRENDNNHADEQQVVPEIEARFSDKNVLIKIHCRKQKGLLIRIISQIEKLHLLIITTSAMPFNDINFDISIMAKMESEFDMRPEDVVKSLLSVFQ